MEPLRIGPSLLIYERDLTWTAERSSGPGGQNVNKVSTCVDLRFDLPGCETLPIWVKQRITERLQARIDADGAIWVRCQQTRSQLRNLELARAKLAELLAAALVVEAPRHATKPSFSSKLRRLDAKKRQSTRLRDRKGPVD